VDVGLVGTFTALAQNVALLLALTLLYSVVRPWLARSAKLGSPLTGALFGLIAVAGLHTPIVVTPGVIADARMIPVLLAGPFGGAAAAVVAGVVASAYRLSLGGAGAWAGAGTIVTAAALGAVVGLRLRGRARPLGPVELVLLGIGLDAIVLVWALALPDPALARHVVMAAAIPVGLFLPIGTLGLGMLLVNEDRRHAERERLTLMQASLERTAEAVFWIDPLGRLVTVNPAAVTLTGRDRDQLRDFRLWDLDVNVTRDGWPALWTHVRQARHVSSESCYRRPDGTEVAVEAALDFAQYRGQEWLCAFVRDATDRKRAEQERAEHLAREQALRLQAEEANVLKDAFLATLSHELRTPLTSILGYASMLRAGSLSGAAAGRALEVIERNTLAQAQIVDALLDVSAVVAGKLSIDRQPVDLARLVEGEVGAMRADAERAKVDLDCVVDRGLPRVSGDSGRLQQVVANLLSNALKFTDPGGRITVRVEQSGSQAIVIVQNTGQGIDPAFLPHVFDRFRQADGSMTRSHGGLGVGLAIVRHLVELHDGTVAAESAGRGKGATFTVTLPLLAPTGATADIASRDAA
jgi:PAS domain S-box-containing protein